MSASAPKTVKVTIKKDFKDAGTGKSYRKDDKPSIEERVAANYEAAGLLEVSDNDSGKTAAK